MLNHEALATASHSAEGPSYAAENHRGQWRNQAGPYHQWKHRNISGALDQHVSDRPAEGTGHPKPESSQREIRSNGRSDQNESRKGDREAHDVSARRNISEE